MKIIGINDPRNNCFTEHGEECVIAPLNSKCQFKIPDDDWFFVGVKSGNQSQYGIAKDVGESLMSNIQELNKKLTIDPDPKYDELLSSAMKSLNNIKDGNTVVCGWFERGILKQERYFKIYRII